MNKEKRSRRGLQRLLAAVLGLVVAAGSCLALGLVGAAPSALAETTPPDTAAAGETTPAETTAVTTAADSTTTTGETTSAQTGTGETTTAETTTAETTPLETTASQPAAKAPVANDAGIDAYMPDNAPEGTANLAIGATVSAVSEYYEWPMGNLNDGDPATPWSSNTLITDPVDAEAWVVLDTRANSSISRVVLFPVLGGNFPEDYEIQVSQDGKDYTTVGAPVKGQQQPTEPVVIDLPEGTEGRYVRLWITKRGSVKDPFKENYPAQLAEIAVFGSAKEELAPDPMEIDTYKLEGTRNVAIGAKPTASSEYVDEGWGAANINDGVIGTNWTTDPRDLDPVDAEAWIQLDMQADFGLWRVVLFPGGNFPSDFQIQISQDGKNFEMVAEQTGVNQPVTPVVIDLPEDTKGRYVRLYVTKRGSLKDPFLESYPAQLSEIAVFGSVSEVTMEINKPALLLEPGMTEALKADVVKEETDQMELVWESSNDAVATVDENGLVTAVAAGEAIITLTDDLHPGLSAACTVYVEDSIDWKTDDFLISVFWPPTLDYVNDEQFKLMADAGIDYLSGMDPSLGTKEAQMKVAQLAYKYGMQISVGEDRFGPLLNMSDEEIQALVQEYTNVPGVGGFHLIDEPYDPTPYARVYKAVKAIAPEYYAHLNFLPSWCYPSPEAYESTANNWVSLVGNGDYLMYDRYPFAWDGSLDYAGMLSNMRSTWKVGLQHGIKTGLYLQSIGIEGTYGRPTGTEIRYEANMALAYGFKQMSYFCWWQPTERPGEVFQPGIMDAAGNKTDLYEPVSQLNREIHAMGPTLMNLDAMEIYLNGETWGEQPVPERFFVQALSDDNLTFSYMRHKKTGRNYLFVVNNDYKQDKDVTLAFDSAITSLELVSRESGRLETVALEDGKLQLHLPMGEGYLYALPEDYDYETARNDTPENENLALGTYTASTDPMMEIGWGAPNAVDGKRFQQSGVNGWSSAAKDTSYATSLTVRLGRVETINRIDLYPAGNELEYGATFPRSFTLDVSEDGQNWTTVKTVEGLENIIEAQSYRFDDIQARYVRLSITEMNAYGGVYAAGLNEIEIYYDGGGVPAPEKPAMVELDPYVEGEDIAKGKKVIVSSNPQDPYFAENNIKPESITSDIGFWTSATGAHPTADAVEWAVVDLGAPFALEKVELLGIFAEDYQLQLSMNGREWMTVHEIVGDDGSASSPEPLAVTPEAGTKARYIRVYGTKLRMSLPRDGYMLQITQIRAYGTPDTDTAALNQALQQAEALKEGDYTAASWAALEAAMVAAQDVLNARYPYQYEADRALEALTAARAGLQTAVPEETDPSKTDPSGTDPSKTDPSETDPSETDPSTVTTTTAQTTANQHSVKTGDTSPIGLLVTLVAVSGAVLAAVMIAKRRREKA